MTMTEFEAIRPWGRQVPELARSGLPTFGACVQPRKNPYSPGSGLRLAALVGRDGELQDWSVALQWLENARSAKSVVLHGLRGEGRTVMLGEFQRMAEERDWMTVTIEANTSSPLTHTLARALYPVVRGLVRPNAGDKLTKALATFKAFSVKVDLAGAWSFGFDVVSEQGRGHSGGLEADVSELIGAVRDLSPRRAASVAVPDGPRGPA
jgi:hypothetical protein